MEDEKFVDESWKEAVANEKEKEVQQSKASSEVPQESSSQSPDSSQAEMPEVNFIGYITSLAFQAMIFLGEIPNPMTDQIERNLNQAKFIIDTLLLLREKTTGNLSAQETDTLNAFIYELQMKYVEAAGKEEK